MKRTDWRINPQEPSLEPPEEEEPRAEPEYDENLSERFKESRP